jgi:hypothetical protein
MKRVLILVLSTEKEFYGKLCDASLLTWDSEAIEGVETIFYFGTTERSGGGRILCCETPDGFFDMGRKTLAAFEWALANREFNYVFRANASLYVDKPGLLRYVQEKPETCVALGVVAECGEFEGETFPFMWGPSYLLSRDVVEKVVEHKDDWNHRMMDDNAISYLLREIGIPLDNRASMASIALKEVGYEFVYYENGAGGGATMQSLSELRERLPGQFAFRVKCDADREIDIRLMKELHEVFK